MSRPQDPNRSLFPFGNPFKMILTKGSYMPPRLLELLNAFEETLAGRLSKLNPKDKEEILSLSWMKCAMESLCETHTDIKTLITALELPVCDWDDKWVDLYLDSSVKLLDICIAFSSELSRLNQGHLMLHCFLHALDDSMSKQFVCGCPSLNGWRQHVSSRNPRLENCFAVLDSLTETLNLPKVKHSTKGKVLMRAIFGVKVITVFVCRVFAAAFSGSAEKLMDLQAPETCLWADAFADVQASVNGEIRIIYSTGRSTALKELEAVDSSVKKLHPMVQEGVGAGEAETLQNSISDLRVMAKNLSEGLDVLAKEVDGFFQIVLTGRDALLGNLRSSSYISDQRQNSNRIDEQFVR